MSRNDVEPLHALLSKMTPAEREAASAFIAGFNRKYGSYEPKTLKLLQCISDNTHADLPDSFSLKASLFPDMTDIAFSKLLARLREKLLESWIIDVNLDRKDRFAPSWVVRQKARKRIIMVELLINQGLFAEARHLIRKTEKDCVSYALYDQLIALKHIQYILISQQEGSEYGEDIFNEMPLLQAKDQVKKRAEMAFYRHQFYGRNKASAKLSIEALKNDITEIEANPGLSSVPAAQYFLFSLKALYHEKNGQYGKIIPVIQRMLQLFAEQPSVHLPIRQANAHLQLFTAHCFLGSFQDALQHAEAAGAIINNQSKASVEIKKVKFYPLLHLNRLDEAENVLNEVSFHAEKLHGENHVYLEKIVFLRAVLAFKQKSYAQAARLLSSLSHLPEEKDGWNVGIRLLQIQNRIEKHLFDAADTQIANFKRHLERIGKSDKLPKRAVIILRILHDLASNAFHFSQTLERQQPLLDLLKDNAPDYRWDPFGAEVIPFDQWFMHMVQEEKQGVAKAVTGRKGALAFR